MWLRGAAAAALMLAIAGCSSGPDGEMETARSQQAEAATSSAVATSSDRAEAPPGASTDGDPVIVFDYRSEDESRTYYKFSTPDDRESCVISIHKGGNEPGPESSASCHRKDASAAQGSCSEGNATGAVVTASRADYSCDAAEGDFRTLEYGDTIEIHGFKCVSEESGVTCHFGTPGFKLSRDSVTLF